LLYTLSICIRITSEDSNKLLAVYKSKFAFMLRK